MLIVIFIVSSYIIIYNEPLVLMSVYHESYGYWKFWMNKETTPWAKNGTKEENDNELWVYWAEREIIMNNEQFIQLDITLCPYLKTCCMYYNIYKGLDLYTMRTHNQTNVLNGYFTWKLNCKLTI